MIASGTLITVSLTLLVTALVATRKAGAYWNLHAEVQRKIIHVGLGLYVLTFPLFFSDPWEVVILCVLTAVLLFGIKVLPNLSGNLGTVLHDVGRDSFGDILFAFSVALLFFLSDGEVVLYVLPLLILALCDAFAALVGVAYGRVSFVVAKGQKTIEGSVMFFLSAWLIALIALLMLTGLPRDEVVIASLIIASFGTLLEGISWKGLDNLFIPFGLFLLTQRLLDSSLAELIGITAVFCAVLLATVWFSKGAPRHTHAAITVVTAVFFCWIVGGWSTVPAPAIVFAGYLLLRYRGEYDASDDSELPVVFGIISSALVWYVLSQALNMPTYDAFNLSFGLHLVALIIVRDVRPSTLRVGAAVLAGWLVASLGLLFMVDLGPRDAVLFLVALGYLAIAAILAVLARRWLLQSRWSKQAVLVVLASLPALAVTS